MYMILNGDQQMINTMTIVAVIFNVRLFARPRTSMFVRRSVTASFLNHISMTRLNGFTTSVRLTISGQRLLGPSIDLRVDGKVAEDNDGQWECVEVQPTDYLIIEANRMCVPKRFAVLVLWCLWVSLQVKDVGLWRTTNGCRDPGRRQHYSSATVDARNLQRLQNGIVPVQRYTDYDIAGQINAESTEEGHYLAHDISGVPLHCRSVNNVGGHQDEGDNQIGNG